MPSSSGPGSISRPGLYGPESSPHGTECPRTRHAALPRCCSPHSSVALSPSSTVADQWSKPARQWHGRSRWSRRLGPRACRRLGRAERSRAGAALRHNRLHPGLGRGAQLCLGVRGRRARWHAHDAADPGHRTGGRASHDGVPTDGTWRASRHGMARRIPPVNRIRRGRWSRDSSQDGSRRSNPVPGHSLAAWRRQTWLGCSAAISRVRGPRTHN